MHTNGLTRNILIIMTLGKIIDHILVLLIRFLKWTCVSKKKVTILVAHSCTFNSLCKIQMDVQQCIYMSNINYCMQLHVYCNLFYTTREKSSCMCHMQLIFSCILQLQKPKFLLVGSRPCFCLPQFEFGLWHWLLQGCNYIEDKSP